MIEALLSAVLAVLILPYVIYVSVKLAAYGWLRGRQLFDEDQKGKNDGKE